MEKRTTKHESYHICDVRRSLHMKDRDYYGVSRAVSVSTSRISQVGFQLVLKAVISELGERGFWRLPLKFSKGRGR